MTVFKIAGEYKNLTMRTGRHAQRDGGRQRNIKGCALSRLLISILQIHFQIGAQGERESVRAIQEGMEE